MSRPTGDPKKPGTSRRPVALITGGARGIGLACASELAGEGFDVALNDLSFEKGQGEIRLALAEKGCEPLLIEQDIADLSGHGLLIGKVLNRFGRLDCLVCSSGVSVMSRGDLLKVTPESYDRCQNVNARALFFLCQTAAAHFLVTRDEFDAFRSIILISSLNSRAVSIERGEYCVSKAAVSMIARLFADRLAKAGVGVYEIRPGIIETEMTKPSIEKYESLISAGLAPAGRVGLPAEVAKPVASLALGNFPYSTGEAFNVDGGINMIRY